MTGAMNDREDTACVPTPLERKQYPFGVSIIVTQKGGYVPDDQIAGILGRQPGQLNRHIGRTPNTGNVLKLPFMMREILNCQLDEAPKHGNCRKPISLYGPDSLSACFSMRKISAPNLAFLGMIKDYCNRLHLPSTQEGGRTPACHT